MNVAEISMTPTAAREKLRAVRKSLHRKADLEYLQLEAGYKELANRMKAGLLRRPPRTENQRRLERAKAIAYQAAVQQWCVAQGLPLPVFEFAFHPDRQWRFDLAWPARKVALEIDGGVWTQGKHARGVGILLDHEKRNTAAGLGWRILLATPSTLHTAATATQLRAALAYGRAGQDAA